ncbi:hypothetical protein [Vibrio rotiferianus]|uniref:hypothetical protein n=1 Tax=Vibrio rotiferianus TaxID=190895 RepID=UPI0005EE5B6A|nr:hypothetical protein [Vibrio rotiferianus]
MFKKVCSFGVSALGVAWAIISDDEDENGLPLHTSSDDHVSNSTYIDGTGNEYRRDMTGEIRTPFGLTPDD